MKTLIIATTIALSSTAALAEVNLSGEAAITNNYIWRGITQSDDNAAVQAGIELESHGLFGGVWASSVDFNDNEASLEIDGYGGYRFNLSEALTAEIGGIYYHYPSVPSSFNYDFWEVNGGLELSGQGVGKPTLGAKVSYTPDFFGNSGTALYYEANGSVNIVSGLYVDGHVGYSDLEESENYIDYGLGAGYKFTNGLNVRGGYVNTDLNNNEFSDGEWTATISASF